MYRLNSTGFIVGCNSLIDFNTSNVSVEFYSSCLSFYCYIVISILQMYRLNTLSLLHSLIIAIFQYFKCIGWMKMARKTIFYKIISILQMYRLNFFFKNSFKAPKNISILQMYRLNELRDANKSKEGYFNTSNVSVEWSYWFHLCGSV